MSTTFTTTIRGITVDVEVHGVVVTIGSDTWDNSDDYYGYAEYDYYEIFGRHGQKMPMLEARMTDADWTKLENEIMEEI